MSFENNIKKMYSELNEGQKHWFRFQLPDSIHLWMMGEFNGKQLTKHPKINEEYLISESAGINRPMLDDFIMALWCVRKCHGPFKAPPSLYRLTTITQATKKFRVTCKNSLKPITSWSTRPNIEVIDRTPTDADYVIVAHDVASKFILCNMQTLFKFITFVKNEAEFFGLHNEEMNRLLGAANKFKSYDVWQNAWYDVKGYLEEDEYLIYLNEGDELPAEIHRTIEYPKTARVKKVRVKNGAVSRIRINVEPNPFDNPIGGMNKLPPKKQMQLIAQQIQRMKTKNPNSPMLAEMRKQFAHMKDYASRHHMFFGIL